MLVDRTSWMSKRFNQQLSAAVEKIGLPAGKGSPLQRQTHPTRLSQIAREIGIRGWPSSPSIQSFPAGRYPMKISRSEGPQQPLRTSRVRLRSHTAAAGERGAGFGRSGQAVSKECGRVVAGSRCPHRYGAIVRRGEEKTMQQHRNSVAEL